jgi:hypothetical protein
MKNGKYTDKYGTQRWWKDGNLHREDGPAYINSDGTQIWYKDDKRHREDGPAIIYPDGSQMWYKDGNLHREDGPAVIRPNGTQYWYISSKNITNDIINWAKDRNIDLNNMTDNDKIILKLEIKMWK